MGHLRRGGHPGGAPGLADRSDQLRVLPCDLLPEPALPGRGRALLGQCEQLRRSWLMAGACLRRTEDSLMWVQGNLATVSVVSGAWPPVTTDFMCHCPRASAQRAFFIKLLVCAHHL